MNTKISRYRVAGYKAFPHDLPMVELAPVTLVIGHNNAGKSSLVRAPVLIADSLGDDKQPLTLNARGLDFAQSAGELFHGGSAHGDLEFELGGCLEERAFELRVKLGFLSSRLGRGAIAVLEFSLRQTAGAVLSGLPIVVERTSRAQDAPSFRATVAGQLVMVDHPWDSLLPLHRWLLQALATLPGGAETVSFLMNLRRAGDAIHHLGPFRAVAKRQYEVVGAQPIIAGDGAGAVELLAWDRREGGQLLDRVSEWFSGQPHFGFGLRLDGSGDAASLMVIGESAVAVNLADAGSGVAQVLPILVQRFQEGSGRGPTLQIMEQPELHLHPAACGVLGDVFIDMAQGGRKTVLVETHSENLLLRVRRRVAEGRIAADDVAIYWVENDSASQASVRRLQALPDGWVEDWPDGVFVEDAAEARALARAMRGGS